MVVNVRAERLKEILEKLLREPPRLQGKHLNDREFVMFACGRMSPLAEGRALRHMEHCPACCEEALRLAEFAEVTSAKNGPGS